MPLYVADYLADTSHLTAAEHGAYLMLIMHYWRQGSLPTDDSVLQRIARMTSREWAKSRSTLAAFFSADWKHSRIESELEKAELKCTHRAQSGKRGGDSKALKTQTPPIANANILLPETPSKTLPSSSEPDIIEDRSSLRSDSSAKGADLFPVLKIDKPKAELAKRRDELRAFAETFNEIAAANRLPTIDLISPGSTRERHALATLKWLRENYEMGPEAFYAKVRASPYLLGQINGFKITFDWMCGAENRQKIWDGNYEARQQIDRQGQRLPPYGL